MESEYTCFPTSQSGVPQASAQHAELPSGDPENRHTHMQLHSPSAHLSLFSLLVVFASEAKHQGCDAIRQSRSANRQFVLYLAHAGFFSPFLSLLCYCSAPG